MSLTLAPSPTFLTTSEQSISLFPMVSEYTVAQAAKILDMSEGCVDELLNIGALEYRQDGDWRWIQRDSLLEFEVEYREGLEAMAEIIQMSQDMGLYDD